MIDSLELIMNNELIDDYQLERGGEPRTISIKVEDAGKRSSDAWPFVVRSGERAQHPPKHTSTVTMPSQGWSLKVLKSSPLMLLRGPITWSCHAPLTASKASLVHLHQKQGCLSETRMPLRSRCVIYAASTHHRDQELHSEHISHTPTCILSFPFHRLANIPNPCHLCRSSEPARRLCRKRKRQQDAATAPLRQYVSQYRCILLGMASHSGKAT